MKEKLTKVSSRPQAWAWWQDGSPKEGVMGYQRCYFRDGSWYSTPWPVDETLETPELVKEFDQVLKDVMREFPKLADAQRFCEKNASFVEREEYHVYLELEHGLYWFRFRFFPGDYNLYLYCASKAALQKGDVSV